MTTSEQKQDPRKCAMRPGEMPAGERAKLARELPQYLTRTQAAQLAGVSERAIDRWRKWWDESFRTSSHDRTVPDAGTVGLKTYYSRATATDMAEQPPGDVRVSKVQLLERIGFGYDEQASAPIPERRPVETIADAARRDGLL